MKGKVIILGLLGVVFIATGLGCKNSVKKSDITPVTLEYWGVFENAKDIQKLTAPYSARHPNVHIKYRNFREDEYKQKLLEAWALGQGPDLFMIPAPRIREFKRFITPMPAEMTAPVQYESGTLKKETITELRTYKGYTPKQVQDKFLDTVATDVVIDNQVWGLPYTVDILSVFYNKDVLKSNNIPLPAQTWQDVIAQAQRISRVDADGNFVQSTIALGTSNNIPSIFDIVSTIMMQIGIEMGGEKGPIFQTNPETLNALQFYLSFAQEGLQNYSWNESMTGALEAFTAGKLAYFIGYPYHADVIKSTNPKLNWAVIPMFKPENADLSPIYANYWVTVVAKPIESSAKDKREATLACQYLLEATDARNVQALLNNPANPRTTALRELVSAQQGDPIKGPYAHNLLNAATWYRGYNFIRAEEAFEEMISNVRNAFDNDLDPRPFINAAASFISQTYTPPQ